MSKHKVRAAAVTFSPKDFSDGLGGFEPIAKDFENLNKWPVENLTKKKFDLEIYWERPAHQIWKNNSALLETVIDDLEQIQNRWQPRIAKDVRCLMFRAASGQHHLYADPHFGTHSRHWTEHLLTNTPIFQNYFQSFMPCYLIRRFIPYYPYQEPGSDHMELFYALCVAWEYGLSTYILVDDMINKKPDGKDGNTWAETHYHSRGLDSIMLTNHSFRAAKDLVPVSHPCKQAIFKIFLEFSSCFVEYYSLQSELRLLAGKNDNDGRRIIAQQHLDAYTEKTYTAYSHVRTGLWFQLTMDWVRNYACYRDIPRTTGLFHVMVQYAHLINLMTDLIDGNPKLGDLTPIVCCQPGNVYLYGLLCDIRSEKDPKVKEEMTKTFLECYGTFNIQDGEKLQALITKRDVLNRFVKPIIAKCGQKWAEIRQQAVDEVNFPIDAFWPVTIYQILYNDALEPAHAKRLTELMTTRWERYAGPNKTFGDIGTNFDPFHKLIVYLTNPESDFPFMI